MEPDLHVVDDVGGEPERMRLRVVDELLPGVSRPIRADAEKIIGEDIRDVRGIAAHGDLRPCMFHVRISVSA
jgi:hypothetical protein